MATGSYTGNAADNRAITAGFQPDLVIVKARHRQSGVARSSTMTGDASKPLDGTAALATLIQSLTATGFTLGTNAQVNPNGPTYHWTAFKARSGALKVGTYTGNGAATQAVTGVGFSPEYVSLLGASAQRAMQRFAGMTRAFASTRTPARPTRSTPSTPTASRSATAPRRTRTERPITTSPSTRWQARSRLPATPATTATTGQSRRRLHPDYMIIRANDTTTARQDATAGRHHRQQRPSTSRRRRTTQPDQGAASDGFQSARTPT